MRTLVLDDDPIFLAISASVLAKLGYQDILTETNGSSALEILKAAEPPVGLILLDLNMPDIDGLAFLRALCTIGYRGAVVVVSGENEAIRSSAGHIAEKHGLTLLGCLKKPLQIQNLKTALENLACPEAVEVAEPRASAAGEAEAVLHYQPQVDLGSGVFFGGEALLRSRARNGEVLGPKALLAEHGAPDERFALTRRLFSLFCADMRALRDAGRHERLSFNIDAAVFESDGLTAMLADTLREHDLDARRITLELTETHLPDDSSLLLEVIARLAMAGFQIAMDDFGTGASNYELLRQGAFNEVKLDRTIVQKLQRDQVSLNFLKYTAEMTRSLGMRLVAEGVEDRATLEALRPFGPMHVQGYLFGRPMPFRRFLADLEAADLPVGAAG